ncbi:hypothetical protein HPB50_021154 [Hyalomma asiaticum]|uniref:Uncharacterized protein n=1 Tax=Hyalomma asiaticum TaxID=266040 RepID=A0ACB7SA64_HYAAI|nr:hypothetical protein HPB50_021154 [Hyalomma asiaticum]
MRELQPTPMRVDRRRQRNSPLPLACILESAACISAGKVYLAETPVVAKAGIQKTAQRFLEKARTALPGTIWDDDEECIEIVKVRPCNDTEKQLCRPDESCSVKGTDVVCKCAEDEQLVNDICTSQYYYTVSFKLNSSLESQNCSDYAPRVKAAMRTALGYQVQAVKVVNCTEHITARLILNDPLPRPLQKRLQACEHRIGDVCMLYPMLPILRGSATEIEEENLCDSLLKDQEMAYEGVNECVKAGDYFWFRCKQGYREVKVKTQGRLRRSICEVDPDAPTPAPDPCLTIGAEVCGDVPCEPYSDHSGFTCKCGIDFFFDATERRCYNMKSCKVHKCERGLCVDQNGTFPASCQCNDYPDLTLNCRAIACLNTTLSCEDICLLKDSHRDTRCCQGWDPDHCEQQTHKYVASFQVNETRAPTAQYTVEQWADKHDMVEQAMQTVYGTSLTGIRILQCSDDYKVELNFASKPPRALLDKIRTCEHPDGNHGCFFPPTLHIVKDSVSEVKEEDLCETYLNNNLQHLKGLYVCKKEDNGRYALQCAEKYKAVASFTQGMLDIDICTAQCTRKPCKNGGTCETGVKTSFYCSCPPYFTGPTCEIPFEAYANTQKKLTAVGVVLSVLIMICVGAAAVVIRRIKNRNSPNEDM